MTKIQFFYKSRENSEKNLQAVMVAFLLSIAFLVGFEFG